MSILCFNDKGWVVSHYDYTRNIYKNVLSQSGRIDLAYNKDLFNIITPLMKDQEALHIVQNLLDEKELVNISNLQKTRKRTRQHILTNSQKEMLLEAKVVEELYKNLLEISTVGNFFNHFIRKSDLLDNNQTARKAVQMFDDCIDGRSTSGSSEGYNDKSESVIVELKNKQILLPPFSKYIICDIKEIDAHFKNRSFDFILIDPPWWNKFIRRKRSRGKKNGYNMMRNNDIAQIPVECLLLANDGLVGVWCTNAPTNIDFVSKCLFKQWKLDHVATWFWMKVTQSGVPICPFDTPNGKKPYERLMFGARAGRSINNPEDKKCIVSVPSAVHSHKPPLTEVLRNYLREDAKCLELFARYLVPGWTSLGNEVLALQNVTLYDRV